MKEKIIIISVALIGFVLAVTSNSWADRERVAKRYQDRSGHFQKSDNPAVYKFNRDRGQAYHPMRQPDRPVQHFTPKFHQGDHYRAPYTFGPKYRHWRHRPADRPVYPQRFFRPHRHAVINQITNYYSNAESDAALENEFHASASVSDSGFSVSVGVSKTD